MCGQSIPEGECESKDMIGDSRMKRSSMCMKDRVCGIERSVGIDQERPGVSS